MVKLLMPCPQCAACGWMRVQGGSSLPAWILCGAQSVGLGCWQWAPHPQHPPDLCSSSSTGAVAQHLSPSPQARVPSLYGQSPWHCPPGASRPQAHKPPPAPPSSMCPASSSRRWMLLQGAFMANPGPAVLTGFCLGASWTPLLWSGCNDSPLQPWGWDKIYKQLQLLAASSVSPQTPWMLPVSPWIQFSNPVLPTFSMGTVQ